MLIVGPIAILLIERGLTHGFGQSWPAPLAVAAVDTVYGTIAAAAGAGLHRALGSATPVLQVFAGVVLIGLGVNMGMAVQRERRQAAGPPEAALASAPTGGAHLRSEDDAGLVPVRTLDHSTSRAAVGRRFAALVAINPLTILAFVSLAISAGRWLSPMWVLGVALASLVVHHSWVVLGHVLGRTLSANAILATRMCGISVVIALGVRQILA
jgi:threonine/homoserine/homoserine lactone efflux protein